MYSWAIIAFFSRETEKEKRHKEDLAGPTFDSVVRRTPWEGPPGEVDAADNSSPVRPVRLVRLFLCASVGWLLFSLLCFTPRAPRAFRERQKTELLRRDVGREAFLLSPLGSWRLSVCAYHWAEATKKKGPFGVFAVTGR